MQSVLAIADPRYKAPMMTMETARGILHLDEDEITERLDVGLLAGWDIATAGASRREIRLLSPSVAAHEAAPNRPWDLLPRKSIELVLGTDARPWLDGRTLQRLLVCSGTHVMSLIGDRLLTVLPRTSWRRGPGGSPVVSRESLVNFLEQRML